MRGDEAEARKVAIGVVRRDGPAGPGAFEETRPGETTLGSCGEERVDQLGELRPSDAKAGDPDRSLVKALGVARVAEELAATAKDERLEFGRVVPVGRDGSGLSGSDDADEAGPTTAGTVPLEDHVARGAQGRRVDDRRVHGRVHGGEGLGPRVQERVIQRLDEEVRHRAPPSGRIRAGSVSPSCCAGRPRPTSCARAARRPPGAWPATWRAVACTRRGPR